MFGDEVATLGDVNGDGVPDFAVGAPHELNKSFVSPNVGNVYVYSGATGQKLYTRKSPEGESGQEFGESVAGVPDLDGDGRADIVIGAAGADPAFSPNDSGRAYVFSGATGSILLTLNPPTPELNGALGDDVAGIADVNGDGAGDVIVGAPGETGGALGAGRVHVFSGLTGALIRTIQSPNADAGGEFGDDMAGLPDVSGDGVPDILVGAPFENPGATPIDAGRAYIMSGATGLVLRTFQSPGQEIDGRFGESVAAVPDTNGDGIADVVVGAPRENPGTSPVDNGRAYIYSGATGVLLQKCLPPAPEINGQFGFAVAGAADMNGDGRGEVIVGAWNENFGNAPADAGRVHVYSGATGLRLFSRASPGATAGGAFGRAVGGLTTPGMRVRLLVGARGETAAPGGPASAGAVYLFY